MPESATAPALTVAIMTYNEVATLEAVVRELDEAAAALGCPYEILIVDDGSRDGSAELADDLARRKPAVRVAHHETNRGIGYVLRTGIREARGAVLTFFPADGQCPAEILGQFYPLMADHDLVLGYIPKRENPWLAIVLSKLERWLLRLLFGPMPDFQGIFMFRRSLLDRFELVSEGRGWILQMELIIRARRAGARIINRPTGVRARVSGQSKVTNLRSVLANLKQIAVLFWRLHVSDRR